MKILLEMQSTQAHLLEVVENLAGASSVKNETSEYTVSIVE